MNTKLKCLLLDDELPGLTYLKMLCEQIPEIEIVKSFNNPEKLLEEMAVLDFDLCITDIEMPNIDGLSLAQLLQNKLVIFTTAYREYASDAFDIDAVDYITKPVQKERLQKAVIKALERFKLNETNQNFISLNTDKGKALLHFRQILYITTATNDSRDKEVVLDNGSMLLLKNINFDKLLSQLPEFDFCRINKKEVVAIAKVKFFNHNEITLSFHKENTPFINLILNETYRADFLKKMKI